jgi:putative tryptophan/tyrosine transport system permease protein
VVGALVIPKITDKQKEKSRKKRRLKEIQMRHGGTLSKGGEGYASVKSDL